MPGMTSRRLRNQRGNTILEALLAGALIMSILAFGANALMDGMDDMRSTTAAEHFRMVEEAVEDWMQAPNPTPALPERTNYLALVDAMAGDSVGSVVHSDQAGALLTMEALRDGSFLPRGFSDTNPTGDPYRLLVRKVGPTTLEVAVVTTGTGRLPDSELRSRSIAANIGAQAGFIEDGRIQGAFGGWSSELSAWGASLAGEAGDGRLASVQGYDASAIIPDYLHRRPQPGHPEATTMFTNLAMGGNDLVNVDTVQTRELETRSGTNIAAGSVVAGGRLEAEVIRAQRLELGQSAQAQEIKLAQRYSVRPDPDNPGEFVQGDPYDVSLGPDEARAIEEINDAETGCPSGRPLIYNDGVWQCGSTELTRGMITPFARERCPAGWREYDGARGKYVIGSNNSLRAGETAGRESFTLSRANMPNRTMTLGASKWDFYRGNVNNSLPVGTGGNRPIDLKPPYLALTYCEKRN